MTISPVEIYDRKNTYIRKVDVDGVTSADSKALANRLLRFLFFGFSSKYSIAIAYYFVNKFKGDQLPNVTVQVIKTFEEHEFTVARVVAVNASINNSMFKLLNYGKLSHSVRHPVQSVSVTYIF